MGFCKDCEYSCNSGEGFEQLVSLGFPRDGYLCAKRAERLKEMPMYKYSPARGQMSLMVEYASVSSNDGADCKEYKRHIPNSSEGCYVATAVYGGYNAPEVLILRKFRDEHLSKTYSGKMFIKVYYRLSPPFANWLKGARRINLFVKKVLGGIVKMIE